MSAVMRKSGVTVGLGGSAIKKIKSGTIAINPAEIGAGAILKQTFTLTGAAAGDLVVMIPPDAIEAGLVPLGTRVTAANTVTLYILNPTAAPINGADLTWGFLWFDLT